MKKKSSEDRICPECEQKKYIETCTCINFLKGIKKVRQVLFYVGAGEEKHTYESLERICHITDHSG
ncbi:hypothetical protein [Lacrimispora sp.]|uniref:hypothetical protein n=1 Tax=Lacrimispora sp. TaxID=2719234 RepID=UPI00345F3396